MTIPNPLPKTIPAGTIATNDEGKPVYKLLNEYKFGGVYYHGEGYSYLGWTSDCYGAFPPDRIVWNSIPQLKKEQRMKVVFIGGPMSGNNAWTIEQNVRRCEDLYMEVSKIPGVCAISLNVASRFMAGTVTYDYWVEAGKEQISRSDALLLAPEWEKSKGSNKELEYALSLGKPVFTSIEEVKEWSRGSDGKYILETFTGMGWIHSSKPMPKNEAEKILELLGLPPTHTRIVRY